MHHGQNIPMKQYRLEMDFVAALGKRMWGSHLDRDFNMSRVGQQEHSEVKESRVTVSLYLAAVRPYLEYSAYF